MAAPPDRRTPDRRTIYPGRIVDLGLETTTLPDGRTVDLEIIRHPGAAAIVPVHTDGTVTLVHQHRHAAGGMIYEVPAGVLDDGELPMACAIRELAEEVQLAGQLTPLGCIHTTPGFTDERIWLFLATELGPADARPEEDEYIEVVRIPFQTALAMTTDGRITDAKTICALHLAATAMAADRP
jgi:ADP-ribose pyrophosphatase